VSAPTKSITGLTPAALLLSSEKFPLPNPNDFLREFLEDEHLDKLVAALIRHYPQFEPFGDLTIRVLWQKDAGKEEGRLKLGSLSKQNNMTRFLAKVDYVVVVNYKAAAVYELNNWQMEALLFHQLEHIEISEDDNGEVKLKTRPHDVGLFNAEITTYGAWYLDLANTSNAFQQQPLWDDRAPAAIAPSAFPITEIVQTFHDDMQRMADRDGVSTTISWGDKSATIGPTKRTVDGETFELDDMGRYVNSETGEYLDAFVVPRPIATGR
jgi:hypothetical protein